ncbi:MAG: S8 family serine peptidase [Bdellovibrionales bacterium]
MKYFILILSICFLNFSQAARVAVTDSGTDFSHEWLQERALVNLKEIPGNMVDDDRNGKVDDVLGWNFVEDYGQVFYRDHLSSVTDQVYQIFEILGRIQSDSQTPEDEKYWKENVLNLPKEQKDKLLGELNFYGQYSHGTHVAGIVASVAPDSKIMSTRVFPDTPPSSNVQAEAGLLANNKGIADFFYKLLANISNGTFQKTASYLNEQKIDVANYSLGVSLQMIAKAALALKGVKEPTEAQISAETKRIYAQYEPIGRKWMQSAPQTLFVVASGNDGSDNDKLPAFPANVRIDNSITVAATQGFKKLADFSNVGLTTVDIAAPGVSIPSSVPSLDNKKILPMSGTSMAAPYIAGVAARVKTVNPKLTPLQIKQILMGTVDKKEWLKTKVISAGVVNSERAYFASEKSKTMSVPLAIAQSREKVADRMEITIPNLSKSIQNNSPAIQDMKQMAEQVLF